MRRDLYPSDTQLARFCAVTPRNASSGERVADSGMSKAGDPQLESVVIQAAQRLRRYGPPWHEPSASMEAQQKRRSVIIGAVANRWLRGPYHRMEPVNLPPGSPNFNAYAERFVLSIKSECLNRVIPLGERHLRRLIDEYAAHYHLERPQQGLDNRMILNHRTAPTARDSPVLCFERIGGMLRSYRQAAA